MQVSPVYYAHCTPNSHCTQSTYTVLPAIIIWAATRATFLRRTYPTIITADTTAIHHYIVSFSRCRLSVVPVVWHLYRITICSNLYGNTSGWDTLNSSFLMDTPIDGIKWRPFYGTIEIERAQKLTSDYIKYVPISILYSYTNIGSTTTHNVTRAPTTIDHNRSLKKYRKYGNRIRGGKSSCRLSISFNM